jgi:hypothetical protein
MGSRQYGNKHSGFKKTKNFLISLAAVISGFRRDFDHICALLGCYAASSGNPLPTFRDFLILEYGTNTLSRNVSKGLPLDAA